MFLSDSGGSDWSRECGGRGPYADPGSAVDHHPPLPDRTHQPGGGKKLNLQWRTVTPVAHLSACNESAPESIIL